MSNDDKPTILITDCPDPEQHDLDYAVYGDDIDKYPDAAVWVTSSRFPPRETGAKTYVYRDPGPPHKDWPDDTEYLGEVPAGRASVRSSPLVKMLHALSKDYGRLVVVGFSQRNDAVNTYIARYFKMEEVPA